jgi:hypothetical protein
LVVTLTDVDEPLTHPVFASLKQTSYCVIEVPVETIVQFVPPLVVYLRFAEDEGQYIRLASNANILYSVAEAPVEIADQFNPPFVVFKILPPVEVETKPVVVFIKCMPESHAVCPVDTVSQLNPAFVVLLIFPDSPHAKPVFISKNQPL